MEADVLKRISIIVKHKLSSKEEQDELNLLKLHTTLMPREERKLLSYNFPFLLDNKGIIKELEKEYETMFCMNTIREYISKHWYGLFKEVFRNTRIRNLKCNLKIINRNVIRDSLKSYYTKIKILSKITGMRKNYKLTPIYLATKSALKRSERSPSTGYPFLFVLLKKLFPLIVHLHKTLNFPIEKINTDKCLKTVLYFTRKSILDLLSKTPEDKLEEQKLQETHLPEELFCKLLPPEIEEIETLCHMYLFLLDWKPDKFYELCTSALREIKSAVYDLNK